jgi:hypothetical protein
MTVARDEVPAGTVATGSPDYRGFDTSDQSDAIPCRGGLLKGGMPTSAWAWSGAAVGRIPRAHEDMGMLPIRSCLLDAHRAKSQNR